MLKVGDHRELQAAVLAMRAMNGELRKDINRATTGTMGPEWRQAVESKATSKMDQLVLRKGARIASGNPPSAVAASSRKKLSGGLVPVESWAMFEFGSYGNKVTSYRRRNRKGGGSHTVRRHTQRQLPRRNEKGRVIYAAFGDIGPRMVSLWVQLIVKKTHDAIEGK